LALNAFWISPNPNFIFIWLLSDLMKECTSNNGGVAPAVQTWL
jgi:hypothetical protein